MCRSQEGRARQEVLEAQFDLGRRGVWGSRRGVCLRGRISDTSA